MFNQVELKTHPKKITNNKALKNKKQAKRTVARESIEFHINKRLILACSALMLLAGLLMLVPKENLLPIEKIILSGSFRQLDTKVVEQQLESFLGKGFFSVDIQSIQQLVNKQPWIKNVSVRRLWPNQLSVAIQEKQAFARWDESRLLSTGAVIFKADSKAFKHLPLINGYSGQSVELLNRYVDLQQQFSDYDIRLSELREDSKGAIRLLLNNKLRVSLGSDNNTQKIQYLLAVYQQQIKPRTENIQHIDFRYANGFAIAWKKEYLKKIGKLKERGNTNV